LPLKNPSDPATRVLLPLGGLLASYQRGLSLPDCERIILSSKGKFRDIRREEQETETWQRKKNGKAAI
jgi:hypothetical protein